MTAPIGTGDELLDWRQKCEASTYAMLSALIEHHRGLCLMDEADAIVDPSAPVRRPDPPPPPPPVIWPEDLAPLPDTGHLTLAKIMKAVCIKLNMPRAGVMSGRRFKKIIRARQIISYLAREHTQLSTPEIGRRIVRGTPLDHSTIWHGAKNIADKRKVDGGMHQLLCELEAELGVSEGAMAPSQQPVA